MKYLMTWMAEPVRRFLQRAIAHTPTFSVLMFIIVTVGGSLSMMLLSSARQIREDDKMLSSEPFRNGFVAISDVLRLNNFLHSLESQDGLLEEDLAAFQSAVDILYVRAETFHNNSVTMPVTALEEEAIQTLWDLVEVVDNGLAMGFGRNETFDNGHFIHSLTEKSEIARAALIRYLDEAEQTQDRVLAHRADVIVKQAEAQVALSAGISLFALFALLSLRAETIERRLRESAEERARYLAYFDPLTDLPNRISYRETAEARLNDVAGGAAILLDLDNFKGINDTLGHAAGDAVLQATAARLREIFEGTQNIAARLSGDEFAAWVTGLNRDELTELGQRIVAKCGIPIERDGQIINIGVSVGIALVEDSPEDMEPSVELMMRLADYALYASKRSGRGCATLTDAALITKFQAQRAIVEDLQSATKNGHLEIYLQPKFQLASRQAYGFEALVRWRRGDILVSPENFIEIAEQNGLIGDIDLFVMREAVRQIARYNIDNCRQYAINVNLSAINLNSDHIVASVREILIETALNPELLTLEITETAMFKNRGNAQEILGQLRNLGVRIAVDDFGAGHASLIQVRTLRPDELKIDRSLLDGIETSAEARLILERMISVGLGLGIDVVVEGVETEEQARIVAAMGCVHGQGYFWGVPEPANLALARADRLLVLGQAPQSWTLPEPPNDDRPTSVRAR